MEGARFAPWNIHPADILGSIFIDFGEVFF
jgi:hypothetical protein